MRKHDFGNLMEARTDKHDERGATPARLLATDALHWFETLPWSVRGKLFTLTGGRPARNVVYLAGEGVMPPTLERIDGGVPTIKVTEGFCAFVWLLSNGLRLMELVAVRPPGPPSEFGEGARVHVMERAFEVIRYAFDRSEAAICYTRWHTIRLPTPERGQLRMEGTSKIANAMFQTVLSFVFCRTIAEAHFTGLPPESVAKPADVEAAANRFAIDCFLLWVKGEEKKNAADLHASIVVALTAGTIEARHASHESNSVALHRLDALFSAVPLPGESEFWRFAAVALHILEFKDVKSLHDIDRTQPKISYDQVARRLKLIDLLDQHPELSALLETGTGFPPHPELARITIDPEVMGGKPCIRGMRITVGTIVGLLAAGKSREDILGLYPTLEPPDIADALAYAAWRVE